MELRWLEIALWLQFCLTGLIGWLVDVRSVRLESISFLLLQATVIVRLIASVSPIIICHHVSCVINRPIFVFIWTISLVLNLQGVLDVLNWFFKMLHFSINFLHFSMIYFFTPDYSLLRPACCRYILQVDWMICFVPPTSSICFINYCINCGLRALVSRHDVTDFESVTFLEVGAAISPTRATPIIIRSLSPLFRSSSVFLNENARIYSILNSVIRFRRDIHCRLNQLRPSIVFKRCTLLIYASNKDFISIEHLIVSKKGLAREFVYHRINLVLDPYRLIWLNSGERGPTIIISALV